MRDFRSFYEEALAKRGLTGVGKLPTQPARPARTAAPAALTQFKSAKPETEPLDPMSWFVDILSRGMYSSTAMASNIVDEVAASQKNGPNPFLGFGAGLKGTVESLLPTEGSVWEGFFGNNPENKRTYSQVIEESTDKFGANDPNYVNRVDNVHPALKGWVGLAGDIALDPLTFLPPVAVAKVGGMIARPALKAGRPLLYKKGRAGMEAADAARDTARAAKEAGTVEEVAVASVNEARASADAPTPNPFKGPIPGVPTIPTGVATGAARPVADILTPPVKAEAKAEVRAQVDLAGAPTRVPDVGSPVQSVAKMKAEARVPAPKIEEAPAPRMTETPVPARTRLRDIEDLDAIALNLRPAKEFQLLGTLLAGKRIGEGVFNPRKFKQLLDANARGVLNPAGQAALEAHRSVAKQVAKDIDALDVTGRPQKIGKPLPVEGTRGYLDMLKGPSGFEGELPSTALSDLEDTLAGMTRKVSGATVPDFLKRAKKLLNWTGATDDPAKLASLLKQEADDAARPLHPSELTPEQVAAVEAKAVADGVDPADVFKQMGDDARAPQLDEGDKLQLGALREQAARGMLSAQIRESTARAVKAAAETKDAVIIAGGPLVLHSKLHELMQASPFVQKMRDFLAELERAVNTTLGPPEGFRGVLSGERGFQGEEYVRTGIFAKENADMLESAVNHWLSRGGPLAKELGRKPLELTIGNQVVRLKVSEVRDIVARLSDETAYGRGVTPEPMDMQIMDAVYEEFYRRVQAGTAKAPEIRSVDVATAYEALQWMTDYRYSKIESGLGVELAKVIRQNLGDSKTAFNKHFETLSQVLNPNFGVEQLYDALRSGKSMVKQGDKNVHVLKPLFDDLGLGGYYDQYVYHRNVRNNKANGITLADQMRVWGERESDVLRQHQEQIADVNAVQAVEKPVETVSPPPPPKPAQTPTPVEAIPDDIPPGLVSEIISMPSSIEPHPVGVEGLTRNIEEMRKVIAASGNREWKTLVLDTLLDIFHKTVTLPEQLPLTTATGVKVTGTGPDALGWRTKIWNIQNQYQLSQQIHSMLTKGGEGARRLRARESKFDRWNDPKLSPEEKASIEEELFLDLYDLTDWFASQIGFRQYIGTKPKEAIPLSLGDIAHTFVDKSEAVFGAMGKAVRRNLLFTLNSKGNWTNITEAIRVRLTGGNRDDLVGILLNDRKLGKRGAVELGDEGAMPNFWNDPKAPDRYVGYAMQMPNAAKQAEWKAIFPDVKFVQNEGKKGFRIMVPGDNLASAMADLIEASVEQLGKVAVQNGWRAKSRVTKEAGLITDEVMANIRALQADPEKMADFIRAVDGISEATEAVVRREGMYLDAAKVADEKITGELDPNFVAQVSSDADIARAQTAGDPGKKQYDDHANAVKKGQADTTNRVVDAVDESTIDARAQLMGQAEVREPLETLEREGADNLTPEQGTAAVDAIRAEADMRDLAAPYQNEYLNWLGQALWNLNRRFNAAAGMSTLWAGVHSGGVLASSQLAKVSNSLSALSKKYTVDELKAAYDGLRSVPPTQAVGRIGEAQTALQGELVLLWSTSEKSVLGNTMLNLDPNVIHLNSMLRKFFPKNGRNDVPQFDLSAAHEAANKNGTTLGEELSIQWKGWAVKDPADFILRMTSAAVNVAEHRATVNLFNKHMKDWGGASSVPKVGWKRPTASKDSAFIHFIDQDMYYPDELLSELHNADIFVSTSKRLDGEVGEWVQKNYVPVLNAWKRNQTINRLGHHIRTQLGDMMLTYLIRGTHGSMAASKDAMRTLGVANNYEGVDFVQMLNDLHAEEQIIPLTPEVVAKGERTLFTVKVGGKDVKYTAGRGADALHRNGLKPTYHMGEGLYEDPAMLGFVAKASKWASLENTVYGRAAGGLSQARDHFARAQHFYQIIRQETSTSPFARKQFKGRWSTLDQLEKLAAKEVKRYHPDASMLTAFESKYMRMAIPFYSWMAKILPAFLETTIRNPGRVSILPKANYEIATAMGVNPDSIYDPFPNDQMFPTYLTEKMLGPQFSDAMGRYYGINPGFPHSDLLEKNAPGVTTDNLMSTVMNMVTPLVKVPMELATGANTSQIQNKDFSDYMDRQIPGVNYIANILGISPFGTATLEGLRDDNPETGFLDPQQKLVEQKREPFLNQEGAISGDAWVPIINWLTGIGLTPMSRSVDINAAEIEARNKAGR